MGREFERESRSESSESPKPAFKDPKEGQSNTNTFTSPVSLVRKQMDKNSMSTTRRKSSLLLSPSTLVDAVKNTVVFVHFSRSININGEKILSGKILAFKILELRNMNFLPLSFPFSSVLIQSFILGLI